MQQLREIENIKNELTNKYLRELTELTRIHNAPKRIYKKLKKTQKGNFIKINFPILKILPKRPVSSSRIVK